MSQIDNLKIAAEWDAGDQGCAQLIIGLSAQISLLQHRQLIQVIAHDPGAQVDIPAWCRITRNRLVSENHPIYIIRKNGEKNV